MAKLEETDLNSLKAEAEAYWHSARAEVEEFEEASKALKTAKPLLKKMASFAHDWKHFSRIGLLLRSIDPANDPMGMGLMEWIDFGVLNESKYMDINKRELRMNEWANFAPIIREDALKELQKLADLAEKRDKPKPKTQKRQVFELLREKYGDRLRLNVMSKQVELGGVTIKPDYLYLELLDDDIDVSKEFASDSFYYLANQNQYHPVKDYLTKVYKLYGKTGVLENASSKYLGTANPLYDVFVRKFAISAVARVFDPGCKVDTALILQGKQGARKSSFYSILAGEWFDDSLSNATTDKDEKLKLHGTWIMEWAELESIFGRKDVSSVKSFLSCATDKLRPPFARTTQAYPRHSIICGSTNTDDFLLDSTGSRRFWVLPVGKIDIKALKADRDRFWADAVALYKAGAQWWLTESEQVQSIAVNDDYQRDDTWLEPIRLFSQTLDQISVKQVLEHLGIDLAHQDRQAQTRCSDILRLLGYEKKHSRAGKIWKKGSHGSQGHTNQTESHIDCDPYSDPYKSIGHSDPSNSCDPVQQGSTWVTPKTNTQQGLQLSVTHVTQKNDQKQEKTISVGASVSYLGAEWKKADLFGKGDVVVVAIDGDFATVSRRGWKERHEFLLSELGVRHA
jgi:predicted P-loop ATPase